MPQSQHSFYTLSTILGRIRVILDEHIKDKGFWLKVEITNINFHRSGHVYLELAETKNGSTIAQCKGMIWSYTYRDVQSKLKEDTLNVLKKGNEIMCYVNLNFDEKNGLAVFIRDIDISFNLGEIEKRRQETIDRLVKDGVLEANKKLVTNVVIQKIAVIASQSTNGYLDFVKQLQNNQYGYDFHLETFPCTVQGDKAEVEILHQLERVSNLNFEVVVIIRGGGSKMDLDVFNSYQLAKTITEMNLPVFTGIGHESDISVADLVANRHFKTPTAVANHLIERAYDFEVRISKSFKEVREIASSNLEREKSRLKLCSESIAAISSRQCGLKLGALHTVLNRTVILVNALIMDNINNMKGTLQEVEEQVDRVIALEDSEIRSRNELLRYLVQNKINTSKAFLEKTTASIMPFTPTNLLAKGFVIPRVNGKLYKGDSLPQGTEISLEFKDRTLLVKYIKEQ